jgi:hypothetical protein
MRSLTSEGSLDKSLRFWAPADLRFFVGPTRQTREGSGSGRTLRLVRRGQYHPVANRRLHVSTAREAGAGLGAPSLGALARPVMVAGGTGTCAKSGISSAAWAARTRRARDSHITGRDLATC